MKKSKIQINSPSFLRLLIRSYIIASLLLVLLLTSVFLFATYLLNDENITWTGLDISSYKDELIAQQYDKLPIRNIAGDGFVQIYNYKADLIYSSKDDQGKFTLGELDIIPDFNRNDLIEVTTFTTQNGNEQTFIQLTPRNKQLATQKEYMVLSDTYKILETNILTNKEKLTKREFDVLTHNFNSDKTLLKYTFKANDNNTYVAIIYDTTLRRDKTPIYIISLSTVLIFIIYLILLLIVIKYLMKLVKDPLYNLKTGMYNFSAGNYNNKIKYQGTKEFEDITKSFNDMVDVIETKQNENKQLQDEKNRLLAGLSHDLKTPITVIQGYANALNDGIIKDPKEQQKYLKIIQDKTNYMSTLINKMYDYSKLDHPDFKLNLEKIDIIEFIRQYFAERYESFEINDYTLDIDIPDISIMMDIDKTEFPRIFNNIIGNFARYSPKNSTFKVKVQSSDRKLLIYLGDNGTPIPEEYRETIFDAFSVADPARSNKGTGLGLAIIKRIVELHGGTISLTSFENFPNIFKIEFPLK